jgi:hypothetical protein
MGGLQDGLAGLSIAGRQAAGLKRMVFCGALRHALLGAW